MADARKAGIASIRANAIFKDKVTTFDLDPDAVTGESHDSLSRRDGRVEIAVVKVLRYGLRSCHWELILLWWLGLVVCFNRRQARFFALYPFDKEALMLILSLSRRFFPSPEWLRQLELR